ncbi:TlpA disulfide reductase family protein [Chitinophagaceae bacterium 26-R-25]|nr:TlpA disulfide reductase family protein [Chitinophagaceae bacterium 26-R-25]
MKRRNILLILFLSNFSIAFCQGPKIYVEATKTLRDYDVVLYNAIPGQHEVEIDRNKIKGGKATFILPKQTEPFYAYVKLQLKDSVVDRTYFLVTNSIIKIAFDTVQYSAVVTGGENEFIFRHRQLLFDLPLSIYKSPAFRSNYLVKTDEFKTEDWNLNARWREYESDVYETISEHKNYYYALEKFKDRGFALPTNVLKKGFSLFADTLKKTSLGKELQEYISKREKLQIGKSAPSFFVSDSDGKLVESSQLYTNKKIVLLDFWASWCGPCREEMRELKSKFSAIDTSKLRIISISIDVNKNNWVTASQQEQILWENYIAPGGGQGDISNKFCLEFVPRTFLINQDGTIIDFDLRTTELELFFTNNSLWKKKDD